MAKSHSYLGIVLALASNLAGVSAADAPRVRLYVLDCGTLLVPDPSRFQLQKHELAATDLAIGCYLVVHPKGTLLWDVCAAPDDEWSPANGAATVQVTLADGQSRQVVERRRLSTQLIEIGFTAPEITYLALSHYHYDHTANANAFAASTWLVRRPERDAMFAVPPPPVTRPDTFRRLKTSRTVIVDVDDYDVFGDGSVIVKFAPGHTPGHQMLLVRLARTGPVLLSGDLYHYPEERTLDRVPTFELDAAQTRATRVAVERYLHETGARLWIQHDLKGDASLKKAPAFYD